MSAPQVEISPARAAEDLASIGELFREYAASIGVDLEYQGFSSELAGLPGQYAPPSGDLLLARVNGAAAGCVALRRLDQSTLEMKRLYVRPSARGTGLGKLLVEAAISIARQNGYAELRLDTLATWPLRKNSMAHWALSRFHPMEMLSFRARDSILFN